MKVYLVKQTQEDTEYQDKTIYVCSTLDKAIDYCQELNKTYGKGCKFSEDYDFLEITDYCTCHYYDWEAIEVDEKLFILKD